MRMNEADRGDDGSRAAGAAFLHVLDFVETHLALNHVQTKVVFGHINERAAGDGRQNRRALRDDQVVVLIDEENIGAARLFNVSTRLRIQVEVFSIAGAVRIHRRVQAHGVVKAGLDVAGAVRGRTVPIRHHELLGLHCALIVGAHRHYKNAEKEGRGRCHTNLRAGADHERTDVERAARAVRRHPSGIRADGFEHGLNELFLRIARHFQTGGRVVHAFGVHIRTEGDDLALLCRISLQTFETALGIMEDAGGLQQRDVLVSDEFAAFPSAVFPLILITVVRRGIGKSELRPVDVLFFHFGFIRRVNTLRRPSVGRPPTLGRRKKSFCLTSLLQVRRPFEACQKSYHPSSGRLTRLLGLFH